MSPRPPARLLVRGVAVAAILAACRPTDLYLARPDGGDVTRITDPRCRGLGELG